MENQNIIKYKNGTVFVKIDYQFIEINENNNDYLRKQYNYIDVSLNIPTLTNNLNISKLLNLNMNEIKNIQNSHSQNQIEESTRDNSNNINSYVSDFLNINFMDNDNSNKKDSHTFKIKGYSRINNYNIEDEGSDEELNEGINSIKFNFSKLNLRGVNYNNNINQIKEGINKQFYFSPFIPKLFIQSTKNTKNFWLKELVSFYNNNLSITSDFNSIDSNSIEKQKNNQLVQNNKDLEINIINIFTKKIQISISSLKIIYIQIFEDSMIMIDNKGKSFAKGNNQQCRFGNEHISYYSDIKPINYFQSNDKFIAKCQFNSYYSLFLDYEGVLQILGLDIDKFHNDENKYQIHSINRKIIIDGEQYIQFNQPFIFISQMQNKNIQFVDFQSNFNQITMIDNSNNGQVQNKYGIYKITKNNSTNRLFHNSTQIVELDNSNDIKIYSIQELNLLKIIKNGIDIHLYGNQLLTLENDKFYVQNLNSNNFIGKIVQFQDMFLNFQQKIKKNKKNKEINYSPVANIDELSLEDEFDSFDDIDQEMSKDENSDQSKYHYVNQRK